MECPNCGSPMEMSDVTIDTNPETNEFYCSANCGAVVDSDEYGLRMCFHSGRKLSAEQIAACNEKLKAGAA
jgi:transcription initiation factor TFIIIB Brf1 subunit/transcription initiation factor TFIIB